MIILVLGSSPAANALQPPQGAAPLAAGAKTSSIPSYSDTSQGLEKLMKDMMKALKGSHHDEVVAYAKALELPDADNWFEAVFGQKLGPAVAVASERARNEIEMSAPDLIARVIREKLTDVRAVSFDEDCNPLASDSEFAFLNLRRKPETLYDVRFHDSARQLVWAYFAYVAGGFRFIGNVELATAGANYKPGENLLPPSLQGAPGTVPRVRVGGNVQAAKLLASCQVLPRYPDSAKQGGIQGTVVLHAIIGTDGEVHEVTYISGPKELVQGSIDAVKRWRYQPTELKGEPVEVDTTISVVYTLRG